MISCKTPNLEEDFALYNRKKNILRTFLNKVTDNEEMKITQYKNIVLKAGQQLNGTIHSLVGSTNEEFLLAFSKQQIYKISVEDGSVQTQNDYNIQNLLIIDNDYCYSLSNNSIKHPMSGFYI